MADLTELQAAQTVKLVGSDGLGEEGEPIKSTSSGSLYVNLRAASGAETGVPSSPLETNNKQANIKSTLLLLANANFLKLANFTKVVPTFSGDDIYLDYYETDARIGRATLRYVGDEDWDLTLERYINDADGDELLDDDDEFLNLD